MRTHGLNGRNRKDGEDRGPLGLRSGLLSWAFRLRFALRRSFAAWFDLSIARDSHLFGTVFITSDGQRTRRGRFLRSSRWPGRPPTATLISARHQPPSVISKDGEQTNHETTVRDKHVEPGAGRLCSVALGSDESGRGAAWSGQAPAGRGHAGALDLRQRESGYGRACAGPDRLEGSGESAVVGSSSGSQRGHSGRQRCS